MTRMSQLFRACVVTLGVCSPSPAVAQETVPAPAESTRARIVSLKSSVATIGATHALLMARRKTRLVPRRWSCREKILIGAAVGASVGAAYPIVFGEGADEKIAGAVVLAPLAGLLGATPGYQACRGSGVGP